MAQNTHTLRFNRAIVRRPGHSVTSGLRATDQGDPTYSQVSAEHDAYVAALRDARVEVTILPALEEFPDSIFVEDPALVYSKGAVLLRPGAESRAGEVSHLRAALEADFETVLELGLGFADGGDILTTPNKVMIGLSNRTDQAGATALQTRLERLGITSEIVTTPDGVLHFKSDCSLLDDETVLATERLAASGVFAGFDVVNVPAGEEGAANALRVNDVLLVSSEYPRTIDLLEQRDYQVVALSTKAIGKIDAGLSCMSLRWTEA